MVCRAFLPAAALFIAHHVALARRPEGPCDIYAAHNTPCVAAHSMVRALYATYEGPLYSVKRASDHTTKNITVNRKGFADAAAQVAFCSQPDTACEVERIWDQSGRGNHLDRVTFHEDNPCRQPTAGINAMRDQLTIGGHAAFSAYFEGGEHGNGTGTMGFRSNRLSGDASGVAVGDEPESMYMVTSGTHVNGGCCFDYGNSETRNCGYPGAPEGPCCAHKSTAEASAASEVTGHDPPGNCPGCGKMEAIYWGTGNEHHNAKSSKHPGAGAGPWVMADLEMGVWGGNSATLNKGNPTLNTSAFVTAMLKGAPGHFTLKGADAQRGELAVLYDGPRPAGYHTMQKQGAIVLGIGGDNSNFGVGTFYEGAMTANYTTEAADTAVHANIINAGYGQ